MSFILFSLATFFSTLFGGLFALRYRDRMHYVLSFSAGVLLGVVCFDIVPEIFELANEHKIEAHWAMITLVAGFILFHSFEKFVLIHHVHESDYASHRHPKVGMLAALSMIGHSFMDGVAIGFGFQVSEAVGVIVALAVISHDFCDGLNTVSLMLSHHNTTRRSVFMLILDAIAPVLGAVSTMLFHIPPTALLLYLGFFAGFLLYISTADILPEAHSLKSTTTTLKLIVLTCLGAASIFAAVELTGH